ncbi:MAG: hypothetical protein VCB42_07270, partial [Myxococcota bacterium]
SQEPEGAEVLLRMDESALPKAGRKLLRRVLHRLRSQGVVIEEEQAAVEERVARLPELEDRVEVAHVSGLDPRGARMVYLVEGNPAGGARLFEAVLDESRGVVDFQVYSAGRSRVRTFLKTLTGGSQFEVAEAQPDAVRALIRRALERHPAERPLPKAMRDWRGHFFGTEDEALTPGQEVAQCLGATETGDGVAKLEEAVRSGRLGPWPPPRQRLQELAGLVEEQARGQVIVSGAREGERLDEAMALATADLFDSEYAERTARRFEESAYVAWKKGREAEARGCLKACRAFREGDVRENGIARAMLEVALGPVLERLQEAAQERGADDSGSLVLKP